jgi:hypothetical protein
VDILTVVQLVHIVRKGKSFNSSNGLQKISET